MQQETKNCQNCKKDFVIESEDFEFYEKIKVPTPTWCPECRMIRRGSWRSERVLYKAVCGLCGEKMISMYDPENSFKVFCDKCWWQDGWDPMDHGFSYDFNKQFFSQWIELFKQTPIVQTWKFNNVNSDYINYATDDKDCHLSASILYCENVSYSYAIDNSKDTLDSLFSNKVILCYENMDSSDNYNGLFLQNCNNCIDSGFLFDCINCQNCFLSSNLRNKKYVFKNVQYSKDEYDSKMSEIDAGSYVNLQKLLLEFKDVKRNSIHKYIQSINGVNCSGNNIENSKNSKVSFNVWNSENIKYSMRIAGCKDCMDLFGTVQTELGYESAAPSFQGSDAQFCITNRASRGIRYSFICNSSHDLFACIGLRDKSYCIFNKQYTKEEYEELIPKIIKHMNDMPYVDSKGRIYRYGEFFPAELSPFCYNETNAQEYFPLTKEEALENGYKWKDMGKRNYQIDIKAEDVSDNISEVGEEIVGKVIGCAHGGECNQQCTEAFKITPQEFQLYKKMNVALPRLCPNCRHYERLAQRNPLKLWHRKCMKSGCLNEFETSYAPDRPEIVYCEQCYNSEVA